MLHGDHREAWETESSQNQTEAGKRSRGYHNIILHSMLLPVEHYIWGTPLLCYIKLAGFICKKIEVMAWVTVKNLALLS